MIRHIVCWKLKDFAEGCSKSDNAVLIRDGLMAMKPFIPQILEIEVGIDAGDCSGNWDIVLNAVFNSKESLQIYQDHPKHVDFKAFIIKRRDLRVAIDYQF